MGFWSFLIIFCFISFYVYWYSSTKALKFNANIKNGSKLPSLPSYYGTYSFFWLILPIFLILVTWFFFKPFFGVEYTSDSASYFLTGIYFEDNLGELFEGNKSKYYFTPSFGAGFYDDGSGKKLGNTELIDTMIKDGLWDAFHGYHMGVTAENVATKFQVTREEQDKFALKSQEKALEAQKQNKFKEEIIVKSNNCRIVISEIKKITGKKPKRSPNKINNNNSRTGKINNILILITYPFIIIR